MSFTRGGRGKWQIQGKSLRLPPHWPMLLHMELSPAAISHLGFYLRVTFHIWGAGWYGA